MLIFILMTLRSSASPTFNITSIPSTNTPLSARVYMTMSYATSQNSLYIFGGSIGAEVYYNDL